VAVIALRVYQHREFVVLALCPWTRLVPKGSIGGAQSLDLQDGCGVGDDAGLPVAEYAVQLAAVAPATLEPVATEFERAANAIRIEGNREVPAVRVPAKVEIHATGVGRKQPAK